MENQPSLLPDKAVRDMEFEDMLSEQIRRNQLALDACIPVVAGHGFSPEAFGILDALTQMPAQVPCSPCSPSGLYEPGEKFNEYIMGYLRVKPTDPGALAAASLYMLVITSDETEE